MSELNEVSENERKIIEVIERLRPYIQHDGGDLEYVCYKDGIVHVRLWGACVGCSMVDVTVSEGIEAYLKDEVPGVVAVVLDNPVESDFEIPTYGEE